ncbi:MAG: undecaprenyldiphospho-muramoylpentapeptide beta-N-acetylglucosaminyltransferase [Sedimentisphaerales bacterium]|nr:undecaprenyldiphospho-muramoylpentapeptide beta-N-acetylglucosaminyltransferase [Sedimentisphaerales bacterium]
MTNKCFFFAGGGTGGHLYPAIAVAEQLSKLEPQARILFFCSSRNIDQYILSQTGFDYSILPATIFPKSPGKVIEFIKTFRQSYKTVSQEITKSKNSVVIGLGGFASGPACLAAHRKKVPLALFNVDIVPGKANQIIARWASDIFVQFADTSKYFTKTKANINIFGCPLRTSFLNPNAANAIENINLDKNKKTLLITGASSGSQSINEAVCLILDKLDQFAQDWQIVHLSGRNNLEQVSSLYEKAKISHNVLDYYNQMPDLLAATDLVVGRSGAVSVAEFAVAGVPSICIPYPHHKDRQQYLNAQKLVEAGAACIVEDLPDKKAFAENLWKELEVLMKDSQKRKQMANSCKKIAKPNASKEIAKKLIQITDIP